MKKIHVGFLLSLDYEKLKNSIPPVYEKADRIFIAMDKLHRMWSGKKFEIDPEFFDWIEEFDIQRKIEIYKDDFFLPELNTIENDTRERKLLAEKMGIGNWLIQVDADEYFLDFPEFVEKLRKYDHYLNNPEDKQIQIAGFLVNLYKYTGDGVLYVDQPTKVLLATNYPSYKRARQTKKRVIYTETLLLHECLARNESELISKLKNWGHNKDIDLPAFMDKWRKVNRNNYKDMKDFFYLEPWRWKELEYVDGNTIPEIKRHFANRKSFLPGDFYLWKKNFGQYFKHFFK